MMKLTTNLTNILAPLAVQNLALLLLKKDPVT